MKYFVNPPSVVLENNTYLGDHKSYSDYNYLKPGIISYIKKMHFETALMLTRKYFHKYNVIDFGCADGPFLPSLAKYFNYVVGVDKNANFISAASKVCDKLASNNIELILNNTLTIDEVRSKISDRKYQALYFLEGIEHIGNRGNLYESKNAFLKEISTLVDEQGLIIISVPNMIGMPFLFQRIALTLFGLYRERISLINLLKAAFLNDTTELESSWGGEHLGFNHKKLEKHIVDDFEIIEKKNIFFQIVYVMRRRNKAGR